MAREEQRDLKREFQNPARFHYCPAGERPMLMAEFSTQTGWLLVEGDLATVRIYTEDFRIEGTTESLA